MILAFRFESALKLRKNQENIVQKALGTINARLAAQREMFDGLEEAKQNSKREFDRRLIDNMDINARILFDNFFIGLKRRKIFQQTIIADTSAQLDLKRKELVSAARKTKILETLKNRDLTLAKKRAMKQKFRALEETAAQWRRQFL